MRREEGWRCKREEKRERRRVPIKRGGGFEFRIALKIRL